MNKFGLNAADAGFIILSINKSLAGTTINDMDDFEKFEKLTQKLFLNLMNDMLSSDDTKFKVDLPRKMMYLGFRKFNDLGAQAVAEKGLLGGI